LQKLQLLHKIFVQK